MFSAEQTLGPFKKKREKIKFRISPLSFLYFCLTLFWCKLLLF